MATTTPLKELRLARKKTLQDVADAIGTDTGNLSRIERGEQQSVGLASKLVDYFGVGSITEAEILYPARYPVQKSKRKKGADVSEPVRG